MKQYPKMSMDGEFFSIQLPGSQTVYRLHDPDFAIEGQSHEGTDAVTVTVTALRVPSGTMTAPPDGPVTVLLEALENLMEVLEGAKVIERARLDRLQAQKADLLARVRAELARG